MTLRETVARAIAKAIAEQGLCNDEWEPDFIALHPEGNLALAPVTDAALRALADAGPDDAAVEAAARVIEQDVKDYSGGFVTVEEAKKIARAALAAAFKTMGR